MEGIAGHEVATGWLITFTNCMPSLYLCSWHDEECTDTGQSTALQQMMQELIWNRMLLS